MSFYNTKLDKTFITSLDVINLHIENTFEVNNLHVINDLTVDKDVFVSGSIDGTYMHMNSGVFDYFDATQVSIDSLTVNSEATFLDKVNFMSDIEFAEVLKANNAQFNTLNAQQASFDGVVQFMSEVVFNEVLHASDAVFNNLQTDKFSAFGDSVFNDIVKFESNVLFDENLTAVSANIVNLTADSFTAWSEAVFNNTVEFKSDVVFENGISADNAQFSNLSVTNTLYASNLSLGYLPVDISNNHTFAYGIPAGSNFYVVYCMNEERLVSVDAPTASFAVSSNGTNSNLSIFTNLTDSKNRTFDIAVIDNNKIQFQFNGDNENVAYVAIRKLIY